MPAGEAAWHAAERLYVGGDVIIIIIIRCADLQEIALPDVEPQFHRDSHRFCNFSSRIIRRQL